jgi:tRNA (cytidine/uridine-2'-O-)-methyltransferase
VHVVLVAPEIPQNTGSIGRLCVATGTTLHVIEPLGFVIDDKHVRRAGLDYWEHLTLVRHASWDAFMAARPPGRLLLFAARPPGRSYTSVGYEPDDVLVFGGESHGLPQSIRDAHADAIHTIPIPNALVRSLNLANAVAVVVYEAWRQIGFEGAAAIPRRLPGS